MTGFDYTGQAVLVTGGMRGIGRAISEAFLRAGAQVFVCGRTAPAHDGELPSADGRSARFIAADIRDLEQADAMLAEIAQASPTLDVVIHNAGGSPYALVAEASPRLLESVIRLNLVAPLQLAQRVNARMQRQPGGGTQLFVGSVSALRPRPAPRPMAPPRPASSTRCAPSRWNGRRACALPRSVRAWC